MVSKSKNTKISKKQLSNGTKEEMEHTSSKRKAKKIALDHLHERGDYYIKLKEAGLAESYEKGGEVRGIKASAKGYKTDAVNILPEFSAYAKYPANLFMEGPVTLGSSEFRGQVDNQRYTNSTNNIKESTLAENPKSPYNGPGFGDYASLLRYAPAVGSLINMLDKDDPAEIDLKRQAASQRLIPGQINQAMLDANLASSHGNAVGNIINTSGGSGGAARANLQAVGLNSSKAKADAFSKLSLANINNKMNADQFNISNANRVNSANTNIANTESVMNMENMLAAEAKKEADRNAFFSTLGQVGVEQFQGNVISSANSGYGVDTFGRSTFKPRK